MVLYFLTFHLLPCCSFTLFFKVPVYFLVLSSALNKTCRVLSLPFQILNANIMQDLQRTMVALVARAFFLDQNV